MTCWGCTRHTTTGLYGFVQVGCMECEARELARSPEARKAMSGQGAGELERDMRKVWPTAEQYRVGRIAVYGWIKKLEGLAMK